tara:strand:- start:956 stop:2137 length:1182 start_codon:yes stop_codon:yes gene_type:complete
MFNKNLVVLTISQFFSLIPATITVFLSGIIAIEMVQIKFLATLPAAIVIVGTAIGTILASYIMSIKGRKFGFMLSANIIAVSGLIATYAILINSFFIFCFANLIIGVGNSFTLQYRFAAAESVSEKYRTNAVSIILFASMFGALFGPNLATITKDLFQNTVYLGSYLVLSFCSIVPFFLFIYFENENIKIIKDKDNKIHKRSYFELIKQPRFFQAVIGAAIGYCTMSFLMTATPISMHIHHDISIGRTGVVIMFHVLAMFAPSLLTGSLIKYIGHSYVMYIGVISLFLCILVNFIGQNFYNYLAALILLGLGWNFLYITGTSLLINSYRPEEKFKAQGLNDFIIYTTQAIGALSAGILLSIFGWKLINVICLPLLFVIIFTIAYADSKSTNHE